MILATTTSPSVADLLIDWHTFVRKAPEGNMSSFFAILTPREMAGYFLEMNQKDKGPAIIVAEAVRIVYEIGMRVDPSEATEERLLFWNEVLDLLRQAHA